MSGCAAPVSMGEDNRIPSSALFQKELIYVTIENVVGLIVALSIVGYLVAALINPEKF